MSIDLDKLEQLARAATPGPWSAEGDGAITWRGSTTSLAGCVAKVTDPSHPSAKNDAAFIAAANPAAVLELVQRLRAAERRNEGQAAKAREAIGDRTIDAFIERAQMLETIVRDLAAVDPDDVCCMCGARCYKREPHEADCLITRAVKATKP